MKPLFVDVDGVIRDLDYAVLGNHDGAWAKEVDGMSFIDYVTKHRDRLLTDTPETKYCSALQYWARLAGPNAFKFLTSQPKEWRPYTLAWLKERFPDIEIIFVSKPAEKLAFIEEADGVLIEDYPFFKDYSRIILIDRPYNRKVDCRRIKDVPEFLHTLLMVRVDEDILNKDDTK